MPRRTAGSEVSADRLIAEIEANRDGTRQVLFVRVVAAMIHQVTSRVA
jgi:hypothetical protein